MTLHKATGYHRQNIVINTVICDFLVCFVMICTHECYGHMIAKVSHMIATPLFYVPSEEEYPSISFAFSLASLFRRFPCTTVNGHGLSSFSRQWLILDTDCLFQYCSVTGKSKRYHDEGHHSHTLIPGSRDHGCFFLWKRHWFRGSLLELSAQGIPQNL